MVTKIQASSFYQHFDITERPTIDYFVGLFNQFLFKSVEIKTAFLNPREQFILQTIIGTKAQLDFFGGYEGAEKQKAIISDWQPPHQLEDFEIVLLDVEYNKKFNQLRHGDLLGAIANLGLDLNQFGDLIQDENSNWQILVNQSQADYIQQQLNQVGRAKVRVKPTPFKNILVQRDESLEQEILVSSLRLDNVVSSVAKLSRSQVKDLAQQNFLKLNWLETKDFNIMLKIGDIVSVRHFGRFKILTEMGETRRGKHRLVLQVWHAKKR